MMPSDAACLGIDGIVVADDQSIYRKGILLGGDLVGEGSNTRFHIGLRGLFNILSLDSVEPLLVQPVHTLPPGRNILIRMDKSKRNPADVAVHDVLGIFDTK